MSADIGSVRDWHGDEGWGVIDGPAVPGGCWAHFSALAAERFWEPAAGEAVSFTWERADQDGFAARAISVWPRGTGSGSSGSEGPGDLFRSDVQIDFDR